MLVKERKALLRQAERNRWLSGSPPDLERRGLVIQERFLAAFPPVPGRKLALYAAVRGEAGTSLIRAVYLSARAHLFYPCVTDDGSLSFFLHGENDGWIRGRFGVPEPATANGASGFREGFDIVVVPGLAYDRHGRRLGQGLGYYDRFLRGLAGSSVTVGLAFPWQIVPEVPVNDRDVPVDVVVTELEVLRVTGEPQRRHIR
jgi:5-formyltetrahydrofolate cyclo-ligase